MTLDEIGKLHSAFEVARAKTPGPLSMLFDAIPKLLTCARVLEHALELGHLGEGSTAAWARKALADLEAP